MTPAELEKRAKVKETYPNLRALLDGRCGPISQWPGVEAEACALLAEVERLRVAVRLNSEQAGEEMDKIEAALTEIALQRKRAGLPSSGPTPPGVLAMALRLIEEALKGGE